jgi:hypothetical protein
MVTRPRRPRRDHKHREGMSSPGRLTRRALASSQNSVTADAAGVLALGRPHQIGLLHVAVAAHRPKSSTPRSAWPGFCSRLARFWSYRCSSLSETKLGLLPKASNSEFRCIKSYEAVEKLFARSRTRLPGAKNQELRTCSLEKKGHFAEFFNSLISFGVAAASTGWAIGAATTARAPLRGATQ